MGQIGQNKYSLWAIARQLRECFLQCLPYTTLVLQLPAVLQCTAHGSLCPREWRPRRIPSLTITHLLVVRHNGAEDVVLEDVVYQSILYELEALQIVTCIADMYMYIYVCVCVCVYKGVRSICQGKGF